MSFALTTGLTVTRPVLRYHGGKFRLAPWIEHRDLYGGKDSDTLLVPVFTTQTSTGSFAPGGSPA